MPETAPDPTAPLIGARVRDLRKRQKLTLADLAAATDLSAGYISQIERDLAFPSITALVGIAKSLGVTVQWFFAGSTTEPPEEKGYVVRRANRIIVLFDGRIVADGAPQDVLKDTEQLLQWRLLPTSLLELNFRMFPQTGKFQRAEALARYIE